VLIKINYTEAYLCKEISLKLSKDSRGLPVVQFVISSNANIFKRLDKPAEGAFETVI
jgi:hypothetical protein